MQRNITSSISKNKAPATNYWFSAGAFRLHWLYCSEFKKTQYCFDDSPRKQKKNWVPQFNIVHWGLENSSQTRVVDRLPLFFAQQHLPTNTWHGQLCSATMYAHDMKDFASKMLPSVWILGEGAKVWMKTWAASAGPLIAISCFKLY